MELAEVRAKDNPRFLVTSLPRDTHPGEALYEDFCCARGEAEQRVKEQKWDLFATRCSSNLCHASALRLYLGAFAYILPQDLRRALRGTRLALAYEKHAAPAPVEDWSTGSYLRKAYPHGHGQRLSRPGSLRHRAASAGAYIAAPTAPESGTALPARVEFEPAR